MKLTFYKYHGTGNDFIMIDNRNAVFPKENREKMVADLCHRRFGIGADGLILLEKSEKYTFKMVYFNSDGNESTMCGNGGRCIVAFANQLNCFSTKEVYFEAIDGVHFAEFSENIVKLQMNNVSEINTTDEGEFLNTGSPHVVKWVSEIENYDVFNEGKRIRNSGKFGVGGTNVNFVSKNADGTLFVRTYERGVEDETYSCGTGVTATAVVATKLGFKSPISIKTIGGNLKIYFEQLEIGKLTSVFLEGTANFVFKGEIQI